MNEAPPSPSERGCRILRVLGAAFLGCLAGSGMAQDVVSVRDLALRHGLSRPSEDGNLVSMSREGVRLCLEANSRKLFLNGVLLWMNAPMLGRSEEAVLSRIDADHMLAPLLNPERPKTGNPARVFIDPGHGGADAGATGSTGLRESALTLDVARRLRDRLAGAGIEVRLSREKDTAVGLGQRAASAEAWKADLMISLHLNSSTNPFAAGLETYVLPAPGFPSTSGVGSRVDECRGNRHDAHSLLLAYAVHRAVLLRAKAADRGVRRARFDVLRNAPCPAILIELGFVSNATEEQRLGQRSYRQVLAAGMADGALRYLGQGR